VNEVYALDKNFLEKLEGDASIKVILVVCVSSPTDPYAQPPSLSKPFPPRPNLRRGGRQERRRFWYGLNGYTKREGQTHQGAVKVMLGKVIVP